MFIVGPYYQHGDSDVTAVLDDAGGGVCSRPRSIDRRLGDLVISKYKKGDLLIEDSEFDGTIGDCGFDAGCSNDGGELVVGDSGFDGIGDCGFDAGCNDGEGELGLDGVVLLGDAGFDGI